MSNRAKYTQINPDAYKQLAGMKTLVGSIDPKLKALIDLRVSQINGCVFCMDMHSNEARHAGETQQRLDCLPGWRECPFFDNAEKAALNWAESLTYVFETGAPDADYEMLLEHYSEQQVVDLTFIVATINTWNRLAIGFRTMPPARHQ